MKENLNEENQENRKFKNKINVKGGNDMKNENKTSCK